MKNLFTYLLATLIAFVIVVPTIGQLEKLDKIEKGYIQTDKPMYMPGDEIWIKAWIVNGANMPTVLSNKVKLEILKPDGSKLLDKDILLEDGMITEYHKLDKNAVGGIYQLKIKTNWMNSLASAYEYSKDVMVQKYDPPRLLMKIDLDKEAYGMGETVTIDFNVKDLKDRPISNVNTSFSLFEDGVEIQKLFEVTNSKGESVVSFHLPKTINTSNISINAKINYRNQTESISKRVPVILENIDLQFLPEGGFLLENYENVIAFKGLSETGEPADVSGEILDEMGQKVTEFKTVHDGMGKLSITPQIGKKYYAKICSPYESNELIPINNQVSNKLKISLDTHNEKYITIGIMGKKKKNSTLVVSNLCEDIWTKSLADNHSKVSIPIANLPQGIHKISLKAENEILSERLIFLHPERGIQVSMSLNKSIYGLRERVTAKIKTTDFKGQPLSADLGIAVVEDKMLSYADDKQAHLTSHLLLTSELQGDIHEPNYYFDSITAETKEHLDLVMLTHGWRSYLSDVTEEQMHCYFDDQNTYIGQVCTRKGNEGIKTQVMIYEDHEDKVRVLETNEDGYFILPHYLYKTFRIFSNSSHNKTYIKSVDPEEFKKMDRALYSDLKENWSSDSELLEKATFKKKKEVVIEAERDEENVEEFVMSLEEGVLMDAVQIVEYKVPLLEIDNTTSGSTVTAEAIRSLPVKSINAIAATTAGITVADNGLNIRGSRSNATVYYVDGVRVSGLIPQAVGFDDNSSIFSRIYNRSHSPDGNQAIAQNYVRVSQYKSNKRQFYVPQYLKEDVKVRSDFRQTIYWNPSVQTNEEGEATIDFFTSDEVTSFSIVAEGITANGQLGRGTKKVVAVKPLNISCKLPTYFVMGDTAQLSVVVNNDGERNQNVTLQVNAPNLKIEMEKQYKGVFIQKGESHAFQVKVTPISETENSNLIISVNGQRESDILAKKIAILNPYFPQQLSFSGVDSDTFDINLSNPIMSTLQADFNTYDPVSTALQGIQCLLRRPSGCFEQVSSSTYPNVMVYQYLSRDKIVNKASLDKAMDYIDQGYKKLAGYETTEDGFEWFGNTPANVALTAYGLLEFTDMAKIYKNVDQQMLDRTIDFLMESKDGKGGFTNRIGLDGFGSVLYEVQTAYVLYALTSQSIKPVDITEEYKLAKNYALKSGNLYLIAMMALTAHNQGLEEDYQELLDIVLGQITQTPLKDITCANTITRSGIRDKNIETLSFCALAIMKGPQKNRAKVSQIIDHLIASRNGGRFGSTQATCLAIQAIIAYADWSPPQADSEEGMITAFLDNELLPESDEIIDITENINLNTKMMMVNYSGPSEKSFEMNVQYMSTIPQSSEDPELGLETRILKSNCAVADQVGLEINLTNLKNRQSANPTIMIGIPAGMSLQMKQLKELHEKGQFDFFEIFDNKLVIYFNEMEALEKKKILLDLKADIAGRYTAPPSCAYPYYDDENTTWIRGSKVTIYHDKLPLNI